MAEKRKADYEAAGPLPSKFELEMEDGTILEGEVPDPDFDGLIGGLRQLRKMAEDDANAARRYRLAATRLIS